MFRLIRLCILLALIVIVVAGTYLWMARVPTLERFISKRLGTEVSIDQVTLGLKSFTIEGLKLKNPPNSRDVNALEVKKIQVKVPLQDLFRGTTHISEVKIEDPLLSVELYNRLGNDNNWARLLNSMPNRSGHSFIIDKLSVSNIQFSVIRMGKEITVPPIPRLELQDLGSEQPLSLSQIGQILFQTILQALSNKTSLGELLEGVRSIPQIWIEGVRSSFPLEEQKSFIEENVDRIKKKTKDGIDYLQNFFKNS